MVVDEIELSAVPPNQIKKLFDVVKARRVKCRHFNGTIPQGCPRIFCTNSDFDSFYPKMPKKEDRTGVFRRQLFQVVRHDLQKIQPMASVGPMLPLTAVPAALPPSGVAPEPDAVGMAQLRELVQMHREGFLDPDEFKAAKRKLLCM